MSYVKATAGRYGIKISFVAIPNRTRKLTKAMTLRRSPAAARHVLVVEDDAAVRKSIKFALELEGFEVREFSNAEELLVEDSIPPRSCLVVDYYMPGMNGLELVTRLRGRYTALPAVLITSSDDNLRNRATASSVIMIDKPMLGSALLNAVRAAFGGETTSP